jgi:cytochrome c556
MKMFTNRKIKYFGLTSLVACTIAFAVYAAPVDVIKERQDGLKAMGKAFKTMVDDMRAGKLDAATVKDASAKINKVAEGMPHWFPKGSGPEAGVKTAAKSEIWSDAEGFDAARQKLIEAAGKFSEVANAGDMTAVGGNVRSLGGACKGCHDKYREKDND